MKQLMILLAVTMLFGIACDSDNDTTNTADTADSGDSVDSADSSDIGDTFVECIYNDSNPDPCDNPDNTEFFPREYGGLHWSCPSENLMKWNAATQYCKDHGGRIPTISELRRLIRNCPYTETDGACALTDECFDIDECLENNPHNKGECLGCGEPYGRYNIFCDASDVTESFFWSSTTTADHIPSPIEMCFYVAEVRPCQGKEFENHTYCVQDK